MREFELIVLGTPLAKQSFKFTRTGHRYQPKEITENNSNIRAQIANQLPAGFKPFSTSIEIRTLIFVFPALKSLKKADKIKIESGTWLPKTTKPDLDNLCKAIFDAMNGLVYTDDSIIWKIELVWKVYGQKPCIIIAMTGE